MKKFNITVNGKSLEEYFGEETLRVIVKQPLTVTGTEGKYDIVAKVTGGGFSGQAGAVRHGIARALNELNREEEYDESNQETETMDNDKVDNPQDQEVSQNQVSDNPEETQKEESPYIDGSVDTIPDNYEPKQSIPELRILTTLSDSEYALCLKCIK